MTRNNQRTKEVKLHRVEYFYFDLSTFKDSFREIKREGEDKRRMNISTA